MYFIYYIYIYIGEDKEFIHLLYWCIPLDPEINTKCEKTSNLIKDTSSYNICFGSKIEQVKKAICHSVSKTFDFS